jgi:histidinol-phosphatase
MTPYSRELDIGRDIARQAGRAALRHWAQGIAFESKSDGSPVTIADRESEQLTARLLQSAFPADGLLGEEGSRRDSSSGRRWIIDPIDGTRDFVRGNPAWAVLLGFEAAGEIQAGVAYFPALDQMFHAARGQGAFLNDDALPLRVSAVAAPAQAVLCLNGFNAVRKHGFGPGLFDWMEQFWAVRSMGGCLDAVMVARGQADLWIEPAAQPWDLAPLKVIAEEAGARFFNFDGAATIYGGNGVICTPGLEPEAKRSLSQLRARPLL